jgi:hypothetical protein
MLIVSSLFYRTVFVVYVCGCARLQDVTLKARYTRYTLTQYTTLTSSIGPLLKHRSHVVRTLFNAARLTNPFLVYITATDIVCNSGETHHGKWTADADRSVVLVWDNSYSLVRSKTLAYKVCSMYSLWYHIIHCTHVLLRLFTVVDAGTVL